MTSLNAVTNPVTIGLARRQIIAIVEDLSFTGEEGSPLEPHLEHYVRIVTVAWLSNHDPANDADRTDRWALLPLAHICHHRHAVADVYFVTSGFVILPRGPRLVAIAAPSRWLAGSLHARPMRASAG